METWKKKKPFMRPAHFETVLGPMEREVLGNLASVVAEKLIERTQSAPKDPLEEITGMSSGHKEPPTDPGLARLLPDFQRAEDEEFDGDNALMRSLTENDICRAKLENLQVIAQKLGPDGNVAVQLTPEEANQWVAAVNDIRLYIASSAPMNGTGEEDRQRLVEWLAYHQDSLLEAML
ncbi:MULTISPECIES: DUF2017 domain-containing protein [Corynebacterium]|uniref:DUF2017 domain-containing protein n=1 Tax=Corynebacterium TaxID=1716 RepID=UPI0008A31A03|nr:MULTISPECIES: DUF2017 domain-containing protein [Corynebacterium]MCT1442135.1 DUF2017 domain-containing protein [Corynebacterium glucuronolyticum]MCT1563734.1 DUF2017 domain-containing protein [Corynebacterium glucuronolyticum]OFO49683.1 hypothetical protein HMPREF3044_00230 [Corynebacterium sp. HMSC073D01]